MEYAWVKPGNGRFTSRDDDAPDVKSMTIKPIVSAGCWDYSASKMYCEDEFLPSPLHPLRREVRWIRNLFIQMGAPSIEEFLVALGSTERFEDILVLRHSGDKAFDSDLVELCTQRVLKKYDPRREPAPAMKSYVRLFKVPKACGTVARMVTSVREANRKLPKPPAFVVISHGKLVWLLTRFDDCHMATSDYINHFYQFKLPVGAYPLFCIPSSVVSETFQLLVMPMGFSWSPYWAQSMTFIVLYRARLEWARRLDLSEAQDEIPTDTMEDVIICRDVVGDPLAYLTAVYDNILIVAKDANIRRSLQAFITRANRDFGLKVKPQDGADNGWFTNQQFNKIEVDGEDLWVNQLVFLGVEYIKKSRESGVFFRHFTENVVAWSKDYESLSKILDNPLLAGRCSSRHVAEMLGVLIWDCRVRLMPMSFLANQLRFMSKVGKHMSGMSNWDSDSGLSSLEIRQLRDSYELFLAEAGRNRLHKVEKQVQRETTYKLCSDSSDLMAAGVWLQEEEGASSILIQEQWSEQYADRSINFKETLIAIRTIRSFLRRAREQNLRLDNTCEIVFGEDNTTAVAALNHFYYPRDLRLCGMLFELFEELGPVSLVSFYVNTKIMPADDPSRWWGPRGALVENKVFLCMQHLSREYEQQGGNGGALARAN